MKTIITLALLFLFVETQSQIYTPLNPTTYGHVENRLKPNLVLHIPQKNSLALSTTDTTAQIFYNNADSSVWAYSVAKGYFKVGNGTGGGGGSPFTPVDTSYAVSNYRIHNIGAGGKTWDVLFDSITVTPGVQYTDTAAMLSPYLRTVIANATYATIANMNLKVNISDTAAMLSEYLRGFEAALTYAPLDRTLTINGVTYDLSANRSWSITAGVWGAITGTLSAQTDLQTALNAKVNITDTSSMLLPYRNGINSNTSNIALKLNKTDTSSMLAAYLAGINTNTSNIALKLNKSDTSAMLANYLAGINSNTANKADKVTTLTINGVAHDLSTNQSWTIATTSLSKQVHTSGATVTVSNGVTWLIVKPALAALTITLPATPTDGQRVDISFKLAVTALTVSPNTGQTIKDANGLTAIEAGESIAYQYDLTDLIWYRL